MRWLSQISRGTRLFVFGMGIGLALAHALWVLMHGPKPPVLPAVLQGDAPFEVWGTVEGLTRSGSKSLRFALLIQGVVHPTHAGSSQTLSPPLKVWVTWSMPPGQQALLKVRPGDVWRLPMRWQTWSHEPNTQGFDALLWMQQHQLSGMAVVHMASHLGHPKRLHSGGYSMEAFRQIMRDRIMAAIPQTRRAGLVAALSMGDQNAVKQDDWQIFRRTGVAHLVSISGLHVTLLAMWLAALVDAGWRRMRWRNQSWAACIPAPCIAQWVSLIVAAVYALFSGWGLPAQRTVWMLLAVNGLRALGLSWPAHATWLALIGLNAALDPWALSQSGFWLSHVAVGMLYAVEPSQGSSAWRRWCSDTLGVQWRITWVLAPMSLYFFQGISLAGLWVNLWAIPWVTLVVTPLSLLGLLLPPLWTWAGWSVGWLLGALEWAAQTPGALLQVAPTPLWTVLPGTLLALWVALPGPWIWRAWCASLLVPLFVWR